MIDFNNFIDKYTLDRDLSMKTTNTFKSIRQYINQLSQLGCRCELDGSDGNFSLHITECEFKFITIHSVNIIVKDSILICNKELNISLKQFDTSSTYTLLTDISSMQKQLQTAHKITRVIAAMCNVVEYLYKNKAEI